MARAPGSLAASVPGPTHRQHPGDSRLFLEVLERRRESWILEELGVIAAANDLQIRFLNFVTRQLLAILRILQSVSRPRRTCQGLTLTTLQ